jgi:hypothetical protein
MFRDTLAVELLKRGVSLETVSMPLGHASIKALEKHDKPWVKTLQDKLEADALKGWPEMPPASKTRGTARRRSAGRASLHRRRA